MKAKILIIACVFITVGLPLNAQDIHFSQFYAAPLNLNPALTGFFNGKYRLGINSKNQWSSVTKPYRTLSAWADSPVFRRRLHRDAFGAGFLINSDVAGDSKFSALQAGFAFSYFKALGRRNNQFLSAGIMPALVQRSINYDALYFDNQFNGTRYDPDLPTGEQFSISRISYFDLTAGVFWYYLFNDNSSEISAGMSLAHLTNPRVSFMSAGDVRLDKKFSFHLQSRIRASHNMDLQPGILYMKQGPYTEVMFGSMFKYLRNSRLTDYTSFNLGLFVRTRDALVVAAGFDYKKVSFGISYDVNLSTLRPASRVRGGFELALSYIHNRQKMRKAKDIPCPIF